MLNSDMKVLGSVKRNRNGYITRDEGVRLVHKCDHEFPKRYFSDFLKYIKMSEENFMIH